MEEKFSVYKLYVGKLQRFSFIDDYLLTQYLYNLQIL